MWVQIYRVGVFNPLYTLSVIFKLLPVSLILFLVIPNHKLTVYQPKIMKFNQIFIGVTFHSNSKIELKKNSWGYLCLKCCIFFNFQDKSKKNSVL